MYYAGDLHMWNVENNSPLCKDYNADNPSKKCKSITNIIYNKARSTLAICYIDNTITLQSFREQNTELTVCHYEFICIYLNY